MMICLAPIANAQDPVKVDPDHYKVLYENKDVRILEYNDLPGHKVPKHSHPHYFVYVVKDATRLFTDWSPATDCNEGGATKVLSADESLIKTPITHCEENTGTTDTRLIVVEFKNSAKAQKSTKHRRRG
jgi:quercetin dioxygenase-like cupin family protein